MGKIRNKFLTFGTASAGVIAIILALQTAKMLIEFIIHGYAFHHMYGWSIHLLGALWSSVAHLLIHIRKPPRNNALQDIDIEQVKDESEALKPAPSTRSEVTVQVHKDERSYFSLNNKYNDLSCGAILSHKYNVYL